MHLPELARLRKCISLIDQQHNPRTVLGSAPCTSLGSLPHLSECRREQAGHLTHGACATRVETQRIKRHCHPQLARNSVPKCLGEDCLACPNIAGKNEKWRAVTKKVDNLDPLAMMFGTPHTETLGIEQKACFLQDPILHIVKTDKGLETASSCGIGELAHILENVYFVLTHDIGWKVWRPNAHPPEK